jgi:hypothetical protein
VNLGDAGSGAGAWQVQVRTTVRTRGVSVTAPKSVTVPGRLAVRVAVSRRALAGEAGGFVVLIRGGATRRIPFWLRASVPRLAGERHTLLRRPGTYRGDTRGRAARVSAYRYPAAPAALGLTQRLAGPEQVFRFVIRRPVANAGAVVTSQPRRANVTPRLVVAGNEDRLTGYAGLPLRLNPYGSNFFGLQPVVGVFRPARGAYDLVFDSGSRRTAGPFTFRFWVNDTAPPAARLVTRAVRRGGRLVLAVRDRGSGVDPTSLLARAGGAYRRITWVPRRGRAFVDVGALARGQHTLSFVVSDYQETKNNENAAATRPNTRRLVTTFVVR